MTTSAQAAVDGQHAPAEDHSTIAVNATIAFAPEHWRVRADQIEVRCNCGEWHPWAQMRRIPHSAWEYLQGPAESLLEKHHGALASLIVALGVVLGLALLFFLDQGDPFLRFIMPAFGGFALATCMADRRSLTRKRYQEAKRRRKLVLHDELGMSDVPLNKISILHRGQPLLAGQKWQTTYIAHVGQVFD